MVGVANHVFSNTVANATGTITIWNVSGIQQTIAATNVVRPQDWNSAHNRSVTLAGNTARGNTGVVVGTNIVLSADNGIVFSGDSAGSSIGIGLGQSASAWVFPGGSAQGQGSAITFSPTTSSLFLYPWYPIPDVTMSVLVLPISLISSISTGATSNSGGYTFTFGLYSVNSNTLSSMTTSTIMIKYSYTSTNITYSISAGASSTTIVSTSNQTLMSGPISWYIPFATSVSGGGSYYIGYVASAAGQTANANSAGFELRLFGANVSAATWGRLSTTGASVATSGNTGRFSPVVYSAATGAFPATIPIGTNTSALWNFNTFAFFELANS